MDKVRKRTNPSVLYAHISNLNPTWLHHEVKYFFSKNDHI